MLKHLRHKKLLYISLLVLLNLIPATGVFMEQWSWHDTAYFYWGECALFAIPVFFGYAKHLFVFFLLLFCAATIASLAAGSLWGDFKVPVTFWGLYSLCWLIYFEVKGSRFGLKIHRLHPIKQFLIYLIFMSASIAGCFSLTASIFNGWALVPDIPIEAYEVFLIMATVVPTLTIGSLKIIHMIGARHFIHFLIGTYHRPVEKDRVVLFLDMVDSSKMAETLEPKESMRLIAKFIFDASSIIRRHNGDILNYTGDGLVVVWPLSQADKAIACVYAMRTRFNKVRPSYKKTFGIEPYFRMGLHAGKVVISQIGEEKLFLGLYGEPVNTASRLEGLNKKLGTKVLLSNAVKQWIHNPQWQARLEPMGLQSIRGRKEPVEVFTLRITD